MNFFFYILMILSTFMRSPFERLPPNNNNNNNKKTQQKQNKTTKKQKQQQQNKNKTKTSQKIKTSNAERQDTFNKIPVEKDNACFIYLKLIQFPYNVEPFVCCLCGRSNITSHQW